MWSRDNFHCHLQDRSQQARDSTKIRLFNNDESFLEGLQPRDSECREDGDSDDGFLIDDENDDVVCLD